jgi:hypothetical protein
MKAHRTDGVSLSFGVLFLLIAAMWAVSRVVTVHLPAVGWIVAGGLITFGVIGLLGAIRSARRQPVVTAPQPPVRVEAEVPGGLPPEMHASIVRELLDDPADRFDREHTGPARDEPDRLGKD